MNSDDKHITRDQLIFEYLEGNLRPEEKQLVDHTIQNNPEFKLQFEMWQATYVKEPLPLFNKKTDLYRPNPNGSGKRYAAIGLTILVSIGIIGFFTIQQKDKKAQTASVISINIQAITPVEENSPKDKVSQKKKDKLAKDTHWHSKIIKNKPEVLSSIQLPKAEKDTLINSTNIPDSALISKAKPDSIIQKHQQKPDSVSIKNITKKAKAKKYRKRITWKDIKRAWHNEPTVVPMK